MASVSIKRGTKEEIDATNVNDGQILFTTDQAQNKIYADVGEVRKQIGGTVEVIDNLTSNNTDKALSANMGKTLSNSSNISYSNSTSGLSATNVQSAIDELGENILGLVYPVGAIYMSVNSTSPATLFGGTWEQIKDRFLLSAGSSYGAGTTGGEATHKLTTNEMPSHTHAFTGKAGETGSYSTPLYSKVNGIPVSLAGGSGTAGTAYKLTYSTVTSHSADLYSQPEHTHRFTPAGTISNTGGSAAHNNMPPYLAVYVWKRTA